MGPKNKIMRNSGIHSSVPTWHRTIDARFLHNFIFWDLSNAHSWQIFRPICILMTFDHYVKISVYAYVCLVMSSWICVYCWWGHWGGWDLPSQHFSSSRKIRNMIKGWAELCHTQTPKMKASPKMKTTSKMKMRIFCSIGHPSKDYRIQPWYMLLCAIFYKLFTYFASFALKQLGFVW